MTSKSEKQIENEIKHYLNEIGAYHVKIHGSSFQKPGIPDILACYRGHFLGLEVKNETGRPSQAQLIHIDNINNAEGIARIVRSVEDVHAIIQSIDKLHDTAL